MGKNALTLAFALALVFAMGGCGSSGEASEVSSAGPSVASLEPTSSTVAGKGASRQVDNMDDEKEGANKGEE
ncbi:MAG: hypothetical protein IJG82_01745, partial [Atopobiaceae bacterium]|nr:hypothetical protein [Atopobiaceae bacterium]